MFVSRIFSSVRYSLVAMNLIFLITGIAIFSVGISAQVAYNGYQDFLPQRFYSLPAFLITTGIFIFLIAGFGFFGAALQNYYMNILYVGLMVLIFIFEISACIAGYALYNSTAALLQQGMLSTIPLYNSAGNVAVTTLWDEVQRDFQCCGVTDAGDWPRFLPPGENTDDNQNHLPMSCCELDSGVMGVATCTVESTNVFATGCAEALGEWVSGHALGMGVAGLIIGIMQLGAIGGAAWIARRSKFEDIN